LVDGLEWVFRCPVEEAVKRCSKFAELHTFFSARNVLGQLGRKELARCTREKFSHAGMLLEETGFEVVDSNGRGA
jgi:hypothetical protein